MHTLNTQTAIDIRMHVRFTSTAHCSRPLHLLCIPTSTYLYHLILKLLQTSWCIRDSHVMYTVQIHYIAVYSQVPTTLYINYYRHQDTSMVHKWCWQFQFTNNLYAQNIQTTIDNRMHAWFTDDATVRLHNSKNIFHMHTPHKTQATVGIRICAWFTSDGRCSSSLCRVYIPTQTHTHTHAYHLLLKLLQTSGCTRGSQMMLTVRAHYSRTYIYAHHLKHKLHKPMFASLRVNGLQVMLTVRVHNPKCTHPHKHILFKPLKTSCWIHGSRVMQTVRVHYHEDIFHRHLT